MPFKTPHGPVRQLLPLIVGTALLVVLPACEFVGSDVGGNRPAPRDSIEQWYYEDAQQLAVRKMAEEGDTSVEISDTKVQRFYDALLAVYNARDVRARDSVVSIHARPRYSLHEIIVGVDSTASWTHAWENEERLTGHENVDLLMERYDLAVDRYLDGIGAATLRSEEPLNSYGLSAQFAEIEGVRYAETNGLIGGSSDIRAEVLEGAIRLHYSRGWGDCPAGCIHRTTWTFRVHDNGSVTFVEKTSS